MNNYPKISIVTVCYNAEKTIEQTILSVINQSYHNIEYIIVDGNSSDNTMSIVNKYKDSITTIISEPDNGVYDAFNKGARLATGDYIQYLNADDYLITNDVIELISKDIVANQYPVLVYGGVIWFDEERNNKIRMCKEHDLGCLQVGNMLPHQSVFLKTEVLLTLGGFDTQYRIVADFDLICKVYKAYPESIHFNNTVTALYRAGGISGDFKHKQKMNQEKLRIIDDHFRLQYQSSLVSNEEYFKRWIEKQVYSNLNIGDVLKRRSYHNIAIWGTGELAILIANCLRNSGLQIVVYIDNDGFKQQYQVENVDVISPSQIINLSQSVDCIVLGFEGRHEESSRLQLSNLNINITTYSWRELIEDL